MAQFLPGLIPAQDTNCKPIVGATWTFYLAGTLTTVAVFSDSGLTTSVGSVVTSGAGGRFANIYFDDSVSTRAILRDSGGATLRDLNPVESYGAGTASVTLEMFGGVGYTTSAAAKAGTDNRAAIQAAIDALCAVGGGAIYTLKPHYGYAADTRALATNDITTGLDGIPLIIDGAHITFKSTCGGTRIYRRAAGMADPAVWANWPLLSTGTATLKFWRGGGILISPC